jgi:hypothetical protein
MQYKLSAIAASAALAFGLCAPVVQAQQRININIGASHPATNIWAYAMKEVLQPEVDRILKAGGNKYEVRWRENYGGTRWHRRYRHGRHGVGKLRHAFAKRNVLYALRDQ